MNINVCMLPNEFLSTPMKLSLIIYRPLCLLIFSIGIRVNLLKSKIASAKTQYQTAQFPYSKHKSH